MRGKRGRALALVVLVAAVGGILGGGPGAAADSVSERLQQARAARVAAVATVQELQAEVAGIRDELARDQTALDAATQRFVAARMAEQDARLRLAVADDALSGRVRAAYELGPTSTLDMLLAAQTPSDLVSIDEFAASAIQADQQAVQDVRNARAALGARSAALATQRRSLRQRQAHVQSLLARMQANLVRAGALARRIGLKVSALEREWKALQAARARAAAANASRGWGTFDEAKLLALLGPSQGRGCTIPSGLRDTGQELSGEASWYGAGFAGQPTASGAIFDPNLFTAAHRTLPFGVFLRVHDGSRCAIVLINDRGPYGPYHRILDLSHGAASYLGLGVGQVTADLLVPR